MPRGRKGPTLRAVCVWGAAGSLLLSEGTGSCGRCEQQRDRVWRELAAPSGVDVGLRRAAEEEGGPAGQGVGS